MIKILTIIGARPQFIKAAVLSRLIRTEEWNGKFTEVLVHTGQHYDQNMSDVFFSEMDIPQPDHNLNIGSGSHGKMTGQMIIKIEELLLVEKPNVVLVYGDTNSTLAGTLAASKLHIPVAHVEAGLRSFWKHMPEEQNRIVTDHLSDLLFCPTETSIANLKNEGILEGVYNVGDIMLDANQYYQEKIGKDVLNKLLDASGLSMDILNSPFVLATVHRAENTDDTDKLNNIFSALNMLNTNVILPLHPRTKKIIDQCGIHLNSNIKLIKPIGYLEMLELETRCKCIITDSGGVQKEAYFMKKPCLTLRDQTEWIETEESGWNKIVGTQTQNIIDAYKELIKPEKYPILYGNGTTGASILEKLHSLLNA